MTWYKSAVRLPHRRNRESDTKRDARECDQDRAADNQPEYVLLTGAEHHPDADLTRALLDVLRRHAVVDPNSPQDQRQHRKDAKQPRAHTRPPDRVAEPIVHRLDVDEQRDRRPSRESPGGSTARGSRAQLDS